MKNITKGEIKRMYHHQGMTTFCVANRLGINVKTLIRYMNLYGIERRHKNWSGIGTLMPRKNKALNELINSYVNK